MPRKKATPSTTVSAPATTVAHKKSSKGPEPFDRAKEIELLKVTINKLYDGRGALQSADQFENIFILRRPTGILRLDLALGGGFPAGGLSQIIGQDGSSKSYLVNKVMSNVQQIYGADSTIAVCMTELPFDKAFAKYKCQVRLAYTDSEIQMAQVANMAKGYPAYTKEQIAEFKDQVGYFEQAIYPTAEQLLEVAVRLVESNMFQVILIDSFGALLTAAEAEAEEGLEQKHRGGASGVITQFMHRLHAALNLPDKYGKQNKTSVIGINQYRDNVGGGLYGNPLSIAGGHALKHGKLVDLLLQKGKKIKIETKYGDVKVGKEINWEIIKGKAGCHDGPKGTYAFHFGEHGYPFGADTWEDLLSCGVEYGIVEQSGAWYSYQGDRLGQGADNAKVMLYQNPTIATEIRQKVYMAAGLNFIVKEP